MASKTRWWNEGAASWFIPSHPPDGLNTAHYAVSSYVVYDFAPFPFSSILSLPPRLCLLYNIFSQLKLLVSTAWLFCVSAIEAI